MKRKANSVHDINITKSKADWSTIGKPGLICLAAEIGIETEGTVQELASRMYV